MPDLYHPEYSEDAAAYDRGWFAIYSDSGRYAMIITREERRAFWQGNDDRKTLDAWLHSERSTAREVTFAEFSEHFKALVAGTTTEPCHMHWNSPIETVDGQIYCRYASESYQPCEHGIEAVGTGHKTGGISEGDLVSIEEFIAEITAANHYPSPLVVWFTIGGKQTQMSALSHIPLKGV